MSHLPKSVSPSSQQSNIEGVGKSGVRLTCYAIQHIPTGGFLPQRERKGHTFEEPKVGCVPRLFARESSAKLALRAWLKGAWTPDYDTDDWSGGQFIVGASPPDTPPENRKAEQMAIVPVTLRAAMPICATSAKGETREGKSGPRVKTGIAVNCTECGLMKQPRGRSASPAMANSLCDHECPGYRMEPFPGDLWPGETAEEFGYPCGDDATSMQIRATPEEETESREGLPK